MIHILKRSVATFLFIAVFVAPFATVFAQETDYHNTNNWMNTNWGYRHSTEFQQKVAALGTVADVNIPIPVLFGVGTQNISSNYGVLRASGRTHEGEDIMATKGTPIVSPTAAVVIRTDYGAGEGNAVYTANPGGETFIYYHLDRFAEGIVAGQVLSRGDLIGYVGNTGDAAGGAAHLHFEIRIGDNVPTNPFPRLTQEFTLQEKITYLTKILTQTSDQTTLAQFLVTNFRSTFTQATAANIFLPAVITNALATIPANTVPTNTLNRTLYRGVVGEDVRTLQKTLNAKGYTVAQSGGGAPGNEITYFGYGTRRAVIKYQAEHNLVADGIVGALTRALLNGV